MYLSNLSTFLELLDKIPSDTDNIQLIREIYSKIEELIELMQIDICNSDTDMRETVLMDKRITDDLLEKFGPYIALYLLNTSVSTSR